MRAKRIPGYNAIESDQICYYKNNGVWYLYHPIAGLGSLRNHKVTEHEDGSITVKPSIMVTTYNPEGEVVVHGFLEKGVWRTC